MALDPDVPVIVADAAPGSAGDTLNQYAATIVAQWTASANAPASGEGIHSREVELVPFDDLIAPIEAAKLALELDGLDVTVDPMPGR